MYIAGGEVTSYLIELIGESFGTYGTKYCIARVGGVGSGSGSGSGYYYETVYGYVSEYGAGHISGSGSGSGSGSDLGSGFGALFVCTIEVGADRRSIEFTDLTEDSYYL